MGWFLLLIAVAFLAALLMQKKERRSDLPSNEHRAYEAKRTDYSRLTIDTSASTPERARSIGSMSDVSIENTLRTRQVTVRQYRSQQKRISKQTEAASKQWKFDPALQMEALKVRTDIRPMITSLQQMEDDVLLASDKIVNKLAALIDELEDIDGYLEEAVDILDDIWAHPEE